MLLLAHAGLDGLSSGEELEFTVYVLCWLVLWALVLPIITFDHPPLWMVVLQPLLLTTGLLGVRPGIRRWQSGLFKRVLVYVVVYCTTMFVTNMAGKARGVFPLMENAIQMAYLIQQGQGHPHDPRL